MAEALVASLESIVLLFVDIIESVIVSVLSVLPVVCVSTARGAEVPDDDSTALATLAVVDSDVSTL